MLDLDDLDDKAVLGAQLLIFGAALGHDGLGFALGDRDNMVDAVNQVGRHPAAAQNLVEHGQQLVARDIAGCPNGDLALDARIDDVVNAQGRGNGVDHLADVGALKIEPHGVRVDGEQAGFCGRLVAVE